MHNTYDNIFFRFSLSCEILDNYVSEISGMPPKFGIMLQKYTS